MFKTFDEVVIVNGFFSCGMRFNSGVYTVTGNRENEYGDPRLIRIRSVNTASENALGYWCEEPVLINAVEPDAVGTNEPPRMEANIPTGSVSYSEEVLREIPEGVFYDEVHSPEPTSNDVYDRLEQLAAVAEVLWGFTEVVNEDGSERQSRPLRGS